MSPKNAFLSIACLCAGLVATAQQTWRYNAQFNAGCHFNLTYGKGQKFPGLKVYAGFNVMATGKQHILINYGPSLSIYTKTIGANLNPLVGDIQIDFTNTLSFGYGWGKDLTYLKNFRTIHTGDFYNVSTFKKNLLLLSSNFVLNNHKRNQIVGTVSGSFYNVSFYYANDGAVPFTWIPLADNFDRYWTGSGGIFVHTKQGFNRVEVSFDQFTGYTPLLYELANIIGTNVPLYSDTDEKESGRKKLPSTFNTSAYQVKVFTDANYSVDVGALGSLIDHKTELHYGIQDLIHMKLGIPLHPNNDITRYFFGASYNNHINVKL